jgi:hypothetical protein
MLTCCTPTATFPTLLLAWSPSAPTPARQTVTTRALLDLVADQVGHPVGVRPVPKLALRILGLINPMMRGLAEMSYQSDEPFVLDTTRYQTTFGPAGTPLAAAVGAWLAPSMPLSPAEAALGYGGEAGCLRFSARPGCQRRAASVNAPLTAERRTGAAVAWLMGCDGFSASTATT